MYAHKRSAQPLPTHSLPRCSAWAKPSVAVTGRQRSAGRATHAQAASMWAICSVGIGCGGSPARFPSLHRRAEYRIHAPASWPPRRVSAVADLGDLLTGRLRGYPKREMGSTAPDSNPATLPPCGSAAGMPSIQHSAPTILPWGVTMLLQIPETWEVTGCSPGR